MKTTAGKHRTGKWRSPWPPSRSSNWSESRRSRGKTPQEALKEAAKSLHGISGIDVLSTTAAVKDNKITEYRATVNVAFRVEKGKK